MSKSLNDDPFIKQSMKVIAVLLVIVLMLPIFALMGMYGAVNHALWPMTGLFSGPPGYGNTAYKSDINSGDDPKILERLDKRLTKLSANQAQAASVDRVHIVFLSSPKKSQSTETVQLTFSDSWSAGTVIVPDRPVLFELTDPQTVHPAAFAVESVFQFDIANPSDAVLAGYRVGVFGARDVATLDALKNIASNRHDRRDICDMVSTWAEYFQISPERVSVWRASSASPLVFDGNALRSSKTRISINQHCKKY